MPYSLTLFKSLGAVIPGRHFLTVFIYLFIRIYFIVFIYLFIHLALPTRAASTPQQHMPITVGINGNKYDEYVRITTITETATTFLFVQVV